MLPFIGRTLRVRKLVTLIATTIGAALASPGCSARSPGASTSPLLYGSLAVTVNSLPAGVPAQVYVGPTGSNVLQSLAASGTLIDLPVGIYIVTASPVVNSDSIVTTDYAGTVTGSPVSVAANDTAKAAVTYSPQAGTGGLWVANSGTLQGVDRYSSAQLSTSAAAASTISLGTGDPRPFGVAFDAGGNLWVALSHGNVIAQYAVSQLAATNHAATPAFTLSAEAGSLNQPAGLAFDGNGNLWVANTGANTVVEFAATQLGANSNRTVGPAQTQAPFITIAASAGSLDGPTGIAFDYYNNLWVANTNAGTMVEFTAAQLAASGSPKPAVILRGTAGSIAGPTGIAFDVGGNLWVANGATGHNTVVMFPMDQLATIVASAPLVVLTSNAGSLASPSGLAFDNSGDLWVANAASPTLVDFRPTQLLSSGSPPPNVVVSTRANSLGLPVGIAFDPGPGALPIDQCINNDPWDYTCPLPTGAMRRRSR